MRVMDVATRPSDLCEISPLRELYRRELNCQIIHDSIHVRPGWTREFALVQAGETVGYGSVAVDGPWRETPALYEFYVRPEHRTSMFDLFEALLGVCGARMIETQSNDALLTVMLHAFARNVRTESILFQDSVQTSLRPAGAAFRASTAEDLVTLAQRDLDEGAKWVVTLNGEVAGAGGVLYHYNRPYGDVYMAVAEGYRRQGLGAYLVQELKAVCRDGGSVPAARCNVANLPSRKTLQKAGFVPCGNLLAGDLP
jgi:GNAT superfamily N-acetyltransferase